MSDQNLSRKKFLLQSAVSALSLALFSNSSKGAGTLGSKINPTSTTESNKIRSIAYNVFNGCIGYKGINSKALPEGEVSDLIVAARALNQIPQRIMLELALYKPNIINFSEGPSEAVLAKMAKMAEMNYAFFPGAADGKGKFPGAVLSHYKILSTENRPFVDKNISNAAAFFTRHWGKAKLQLPDGKFLVVHTAHLWPFKKNEQDTDIRLQEIKELHRAIELDLQQENTSVLLQGDLNHAPDSTEYQALCSGKLIDTFVKAGTGDGNTINSVKNTRRIDYILAAGDIASKLQACRSLYQGNFRMNNEDPMGFALSDHLPVMADFNY